MKVYVNQIAKLTNNFNIKKLAKNEHVVEIWFCVEGIILYERLERRHVNAHALH